MAFLVVGTGMRDVGTFDPVSEMVAIQTVARSHRAEDDRVVVAGDVPSVRDAFPVGTFACGNEPNPC